MRMLLISRHALSSRFIIYFMNLISDIFLRHIANKCVTVSLFYVECIVDYSNFHPKSDSLSALS